MTNRGYTTDIPAVAGRKEREQADGCVFGRVHCARKVIDAGPLHGGIVDRPPHGLRGEESFRQIKVAKPNEGSVQSAKLVGDRSRHDLDLTREHRGARSRPRARDGSNSNVTDVAGKGRVVDLLLNGYCNGIVEVECTNRV